MNKLKLFFASILAISVFVPVMALVSPVAGAQGLDINKALCNGANNSSNPDAACTVKDSEGKDQVQKTVNTIVSIFSWVVGIVSVIMIIYGGFRYIISGGDSGKVTSAKNTILFALLGLVLVGISQIIVRFVIGWISDATTSDTTPAE